ncbi:hypothetical protein FNV43_RR16978 [Rhamnella rubrinervis]|uniref:Uncharacterized protein n=1 Tax=Rhamnella rubrinervis TaxID=2594499 RepID=A0A8K0GZQ6_9ROSA|nr:hypothetical protein FNV43_RR16978 [Rhamnella rubrinervis]
MTEMMSKKQVRNFVVVFVAMVLMANYFVCCENTNIGDIGSDHHHHDHHKDGINVKEGHDLAPHHHHDGNRKMEADGVIRPNYGCLGSACLIFNNDCKGRCFCLPISLLFTGLCVGNCCH